VRLQHLNAVVGRAPSPSFTPTSPRFLYNPLINELTGQDFVPSLVYSSNTHNDSTTTTTSPTAIASTSDANASLIAETNAETLDTSPATPPPSLTSLPLLSKDRSPIRYTLLTRSSHHPRSPRKPRRASSPRLTTSLVSPLLPPLRPLFLAELAPPMAPRPPVAPQSSTTHLRSRRPSFPWVLASPLRPRPVSRLAPFASASATSRRRRRGP